jgi:DNA repair protein RadB
LTVYPSACGNIDTLVGGGFPAGAISHIFGEPGTGKTTLCLQLAINVTRSGKRAVFIATDQFPGGRFAQIAGTDTELLAQKMIVFEVTSFSEQQATFHKIKKIAKENVGLVALDTMTMYYRLEQAKSNETMLRHRLANQALGLLGLARKHGIATVITNQVYADVETRQVLPVAGYILDPLSAIVLQFKKTDSERRCAVLKNHRTSIREEYAYFKITDRGLVDV